jgi:hypothetical protein
MCKLPPNIFWYFRDTHVDREGEESQEVPVGTQQSGSQIIGMSFTLGVVSGSGEIISHSEVMEVDVTAQNKVTEETENVTEIPQIVASSSGIQTPVSPQDSEDKDDEEFDPYDKDIQSSDDEDILKKKLTKTPKPKERKGRT